MALEKLYIAGPMSNIPDFNYPAFKEAEACLLTVGYRVVNPARFHDLSEPLPEYSKMLGGAIKQMIDCEGVALLPGWENSYGAWLEASVARALNYPIRPIQDWLDIAIRGKA